MIRKTMLGLAAVAALTAAASTANAGVRIYFGGPTFGWGYQTHYYGGYYAPYSYYGCPKVFVGYKKFWNGYHWKTRKVFKRICY